MMKFRNLILLAAGFLLATAGLVMADDGDGGYAAPYLQIPIGARPTAMGGAYLGLSDDGAGPLFNPAGVATVDRKLFSSSYRAMDLDRNLGYVSFIIPTRQQSVLSFDFLYFGGGDVQRRDSDGRLIDGDLSFNTFAGSALFAKRFEPYLSLGLRASYLQTSFAEMSAFTVGITAGAMLYFDYLFLEDRRLEPDPNRAVQDIRLGVVVKNLASTFTWNSGEYNDVYGGDFGVEQEDEVPLEVGVGASARFFQRKLVLATDVYKNLEQNPRLHAGAEYFWRPEFALRAGYSDRRFTAGTGYVFKFENQTLAIDYAFATDRVDEGSEHIFSFDLLF